MRKTKRAQQADEAHVERERRRAAASRIDRVMAERAEAGDRAFEEQLEDWKRSRTEAPGTQVGREGT
jgi:hypothetical protein